MATCPTCGQHVPKPKPLDAEQLLAILRDGVPHREVYEGQDGGWYVTYGGGKTSPEAIRVLLDRKMIVKVYDEYDGSFHIGRTLDMTATKAETKKFGRRGKLVYTDGTTAAR